MVSTNATGKHTSRVWDIQWVSGGQELSNQQQNDDGQKSGIQIGQSSQEVDTLVSVSTDGRVVERSLKRSFEHRDILTLVNLQPHPVALVQNNQKTQGQKMTIIRKLAAGLCLDFIDSQSYLVGGDDALVRKSSRSYAD